MEKELTLKDIQKMLVGMQTSIDARFNAVDKRFDAMDTRFDAMDTRFDEMDERFDDMHEAMNLHSSETDEQFRQLRTSVATKDYVDDRIGKLRGEFRQALKTSRGRTL